MPLIECNLAVLTIATLYYLWRDYYRPQLLRREQILRHRVAYMLWVAATEMD